MMAVHKNVNIDLRTLALAGRWQEVLDVARRWHDKEPSIETSLYEVTSLRALGHGIEANQRLQAISTGKLSAGLQVAAQLGEELLQCAFFSELEPIIGALEKKQHPAHLFLRAGLGRERMNWVDALSAAHRLATFPDPWNRLSKIALASIRLRQGWLDECEKLLLPFSDDQTPATQKLWARLEIASGSFPAAKVRLSELAKKQPLDWEWPVLMAAVEGSMGSPVEQCLRIVESGLKRNPRQADAWALVVRLRLAMNDEVNAKVAMGEALKIKPWNDQACLPFIERAAVARNFSEANAFLNTLRKLAETPRRQAIEIDLMRMQGAKVRELIKSAEILAKKYPDDPDVLRASAAAMVACKRVESATSLLEKVLSFNRKDRAAANNLATLYQQLGDFEDAARVWRDLAENGDLASKINLARALLENGDIAEAENLYKSIADSTGGDIQPQVARGLIQIQTTRGEIVPALHLAKRICEQQPSNSDNWVLHSKLVADVHGLAAAMQLLESAEPLVDAPLQLHRALFNLLQNQLKPIELVARVRKWRGLYPDEVEYYFLEGNALEQSQDWDGAEKVLREAARIDPERGVVNLIRFYFGRMRLGAARLVAEQWLREDKADIRRWAQLAEVHYMEQKPLDALVAVDKALKIDPNRFSLVRQKIGILLTSNRHDEAISIARDQWQAKGELAALWLLLDVLRRALKFEEGLLEIQQALRLRPNNRDLRLRLSRQLRYVQREQEALDELRSIHIEEPGSDLIAKELIGALMRTHAYGDAYAVLAEFAAAQRNRMDLQVTIADIAIEQGLLEQARDRLNEVIGRAPEMLQAWLTACKLERRADDASAEITLWRQIADRFPVRRWVETSLDRWIELGLEDDLLLLLNRWRESEPENVAPWWAGFEAARRKKLFAAAESLLDGIERRQGSSAKSLASRALIFDETNRVTDAISLLKRAVELSPNDPRYLSMLLGYELKVGNWETFDKYFERLEFLLGDKRFKEYKNLFFNINCHPSWDANRIYSYYRSWYAHEVQPYLLPAKPFALSSNKSRKLRIGYVSPDFRQHVVAKFSEPILKFHDKHQFEIFAYAHLERNQSDSWTDKFKSYFHHWREIRELSTDELERLIREDKIDILVDLAGHSSNNRLDVFIRRPAPILASHTVGAGQTTGIKEIDYLIVSKDSWPEKFDDCAAEEVVRLPVKGLPYSPPENVPPAQPLPCVTKGYVTFGVFARPLRVNSRVIAAWAEILRQVPGSKIRFEHAPYTDKSLQARFSELFEQHGIGNDRLEFANTRPYWNAFNGIDIMLDTFPAASGSTATEALYMERLVVTFKGTPTMGLTSYQQLAALKLDSDCSADSEVDYVSKAVTLASDINNLLALSLNLRTRFQNSSIFDYTGYAGALTNMYRKWWHIWCDNSTKS